MAALKFTSEERQEIYRLIVLLNGSLQFIVLRLEELAAAKILDPKYLKEMKELRKSKPTWTHCWNPSLRNANPRNVNPSHTLTRPAQGGSLFSYRSTPYH
jgi:hypothetical protein